jgi:hypothetical protein
MVVLVIRQAVGGHKLSGKSFEGLKPDCEISDEVHFTSLFHKSA